jgi:hypothetical protein
MHIKSYPSWERGYGGEGYGGSCSPPDGVLKGERVVLSMKTGVSLRHDQHTKNADIYLTAT